MWKRLQQKYKVVVSRLAKNCMMNLAVQCQLLARCIYDVQMCANNSASMHMANLFFYSMIIACVSFRSFHLTCIFPEIQ